MKEVETEFRPDGIVSRDGFAQVVVNGELLYEWVIWPLVQHTRVSEVVVGRMRLWDDWEEDSAPQNVYGDEIPDQPAPGWYWVRGHWRHRNPETVTQSLDSHTESRVTTTEPQIETYSDIEGVDESMLVPPMYDQNGWPDIPESQDYQCAGTEEIPEIDKRIADVFKRLDNPDCKGDTIRVAGHSEESCGP